MKQLQVMQNTENKCAKIIELFSSISGEGGTSGVPATFVRVAGCNLRCDFCDTKYSFDLNDSSIMTFPQILEKVKDFGNKVIICTGGEPLLDIVNHRELPLYLALNGYEVYIETNGAIELYTKEELKNRPNNLKYVVDIKCPISKMEKYDILEKNAKYLEDGDEIKAVIANEEDFEFFISKVKNILDIIKDKKINLILSPVFGEISLEKLASFVQNGKDNFKGTELTLKMGIQLHKLIWPQIERGV